MDMLTVGNEVTIKVRNALYDVRHRYANGYVGPEIREYTGTVVREKWFATDEIGITTGDPRFPFRRIHRSRIVEIGGAKIDYAPVKSAREVITVQGSKGNSYVVTKEDGKASCTCVGYSFRKTCKHTQEVLA
jgi:hypothetical protein